MICLPIVARANAEALDLLRRASGEPADCYELRLDLFREQPDIRQLLAAADKPVIATVRSRRQGGEYDGDTETRLALLQEAADAGAQYIDAEEDIADRLQRREKTTIITSWHDFQGIPDDLDAVVRRLEATRGDWVKFAVTPRVLSDNLAVLDALTRARKPAIGIAMGERGLPTRILGPAYGSRLTFGTLSAGLESAPGQTTARQLAEQYRIHSLTRNTTIYGLAGDPVSKSSGPAMHNRAFSHLGIDAVYIPFLCRDDFAAFLHDAPTRIPLRGLSVTMPLKQEALALAPCASDTARRAGAANTLTWKDGAWHADNTDFTAVAGLVGAAAVTAGLPLDGEEALVLGTGGAGRAIGWALASLGCRIWTSGRDSGKTTALAQAMHWEPQPWETRANRQWRVVANSTSVGMSPDTEDTPFPGSAWKTGMLAFDAVYNPRETRFLREAKKSGAAVADGVEMFLRQGAEQFRLWTGVSMPECGM